MMVHHQTGEGGSLGALCSVPWAQSRCLDTHRPLGPAPGQPDTHVLPSVSHAHPIPKGRLPAQGILFSQTRPWRCELGREAPPGWAIRRCPEQCLGAWGGAVDGVAAQPGLTDPPHPGRGSGCWGPRWGGPSLGRVGSWSWAQDKALLASRRSPRSFSRQASGCHWAAAGSWGLPVPPGAGGLGDRAMQVRVAGVPVLPRARASERGEPVVHQLGPWSTCGWGSLLAEGAVQQGGAGEGVRVRGLEAGRGGVGWKRAWVWAGGSLGCVWGGWGDGVGAGSRQLSRAAALPRGVSSAWPHAAGPRPRRGEHTAGPGAALPWSALGCQLPAGL